MLLRNLSELKELYWKYRTLQPQPDSDPFVLTASQIWLFARDLGLATPACSLARLDRMVFSGLRHHSDTAPDDGPEIAPLTPRAEQQERRRVSVSDHVASGASGGHGSRPMSQQAGAVGAGHEMAAGEEACLRPTSQGAASQGGASHMTDGSRPASQGHTSQAAESEDSGSLASSVAASPQPSRREPPQTPAGEGTDPATVGEDGLRPASSSAASDAVTTPAAGIVRLGSKDRPFSREVHIADGDPSGRFARPEDSEQLANIHSPKRPLLFRSFLEGMVRMSMARYPNERGLEPQIQRLFKERILPHFDEPYKSEDTFLFLVDKDFQPTLEEFQPLLWRLFRGEDRDDAEPVPGMFAEGGSPASAALRIPPGSASFGATRRKLHVRARLDVTARVKDLLRLLDGLGFLRPIPRKQICQDDLYAELFWDSIDDESHSAEGDGSQTGEKGDRTGHPKMSLGLAGGLGGPPPTPSQIVQQEHPRAQSGSRGHVSSSASRRVGDKDRDPDRGADEDKDVSPRKASGGPTATATPAELLRCDFAVTALEVFRLLSEVSAPSTVESLKWALDPDESHLWDECVSAVEYAESEVIFPEFLRFLVRLAEQGTLTDPALCERVSVARRFDGFLRHVFVPALRSQYVPPEPLLEEEPGTPEDASATEDYLLGPPPAPPAAEVPVDAGDGDGEGAEEAPREAQDVPPEPSLWPGFEGRAADGAAAALTAAPRRWPRGYEQEVAQWR